MFIVITIITTSSWSCENYFTLRAFKQFQTSSWLNFDDPQVHLLAEPFCVVMHRHLSSQHPLNELLKYHCRGLLATNTLGSPSLVNEGGYMDILTAIGHKGTILLLERGYKTLGWKDTDFHQDIKVANKIIFAFSEKERKKSN